MRNGESIEVRRYGTSGPEVFVLHGGPGAPGSVASLARALAPSFRVAEPLQRRRGAVALTVAAHVDDLAAIVDEPALFVGWSWGAMLGLSFAARHADRVRGLVLVGCGTYDEAERRLYAARMRERLGEDGRRQFDALRALVETATDPADRDRHLSAMGALADAAQAVDPLPGDADRLEVDGPGHAETWADVLRLQAEGVEPAAFRTVQAPVLMLHGAEDPHPGPETRDRLCTFVPQLEYVEFPRCGHAPWRERHAHEAFCEVLSAWLRSRADGGSGTP